MLQVDENLLCPKIRVPELTLFRPMMNTALILRKQPSHNFKNFASLTHSNSGNSQPLTQIPRHLSAEPSRRPANHLLISNVAASPSPSVSGSSDQYLDGGTRKQRKMVAGIDQDELLDPVNLADPDSCFCEFQGVHIHHKVYDPQSHVNDIPETVDAQLSSKEQKIGFPMILLHGFGASVFSWDRVMKPLARLIGSKVLAFDRPAFGLTSRVLNRFDSRKLNPYSMAFSVLATTFFIDFLGAQKAILVGHSAGSLVAVDSYFEASERVAALILVAPAIFAPRPAPVISEENKQREEDHTSSTNKESPFTKFLRILTQFGKHIIQAIIGMLQGMAGMLSSLYKKALSALLRSSFGVMLVRMAIDRGGIAAVRNAWYDSKQVTEDILRGYTKPLKTKGWDRALVEFTIAMLTDNGSGTKPTLAKRLQEIKCPVLIVTGDTDRIVPAWNAERLSRAIPGSVFEVIKNCGHLPQEEKPDEFIAVVTKFLQRAFGGLEEEEQNVKFPGVVVS